MLLELGLHTFEAFGPRACKGDYRAYKPTLLLALALPPELAKLLELGPDAYKGNNKAHRLQGCYPGLGGTFPAA